MDGPDAALLAKRAVIWWVPIPCGENGKPAGFKCADAAQQDGKHLIPLRNREGAAGQKIFLNIDNQ